MGTTISDYVVRAAFILEPTTQSVWQRHKSVLKEIWLPCGFPPASPLSTQAGSPRTRDGRHGDGDLTGEWLTGHFYLRGNQPSGTALTGLTPGPTRQGTATRPAPVTPSPPLPPLPAPVTPSPPPKGLSRPPTAHYHLKVFLLPTQTPSADELLQSLQLYFSPSVTLYAHFARRIAKLSPRLSL